MEDSSYIVQLLIGVFFTAASVPLFRLAGRSGELPERMLGWCFLCFGLSYLFYETPFLPGLEALLTPFSFIARLITGAGVIAVALFTWQAFRRDDAWAKWLAIGSGVSIAIGDAMSPFWGDWEGFMALSNPFFWFEWAGQTVPLAWICVEGFMHYRRARKRARFGLGDSTVANRFFLWGMFGLAQTGAMLTVVPMNIDYELHGSFAAWSDSLIGAFEGLSIVMIWLAFFPPALYRRFLERARAEGAAEGSRP
jgi:hypothetical protein